MVAVTKLRPALSERSPQNSNSAGPLRLIKGSFSPKKVARQFPFVGSLHRAIDGALFGVLMAVALMSALTLHWQHLWTVAFTRLEDTRELSDRLTESTALLEQHLLQRTDLPQSLVPTKAANLIYLDRSESSVDSKANNLFKWSAFRRFIFS